MGIEKNKKIVHPKYLVAIDITCLRLSSRMCYRNNDNNRKTATISMTKATNKRPKNRMKQIIKKKIWQTAYNCLMHGIYTNCVFVWARGICSPGATVVYKSHACTLWFFVYFNWAMLGTATKLLSIAFVFMYINYMCGWDQQRDASQNECVSRPYINTQPYIIYVAAFCIWMHLWAKVRVIPGLSKYEHTAQ